MDLGTGATCSYESIPAEPVRLEDLVLLELQLLLLLGQRLHQLTQLTQRLGVLCAYLV